MQLWPHQVEAIEVCERAQRGKRSRVLVQVPPGTGKTEIAARVALSWVQARPFGRAVVCVSSGPVLEQFARRLRSSTRLPIGIERAELRAVRSCRLVIATQQSLWGRLASYDPDTLLIYDECHHGNLDAPENLRLAQRFHHVVGLSATPWSSGCVNLFAESDRVTLPLWQAQREALLAPHEILPWVPPAGPLGLVFCASNRACEAASRNHALSSWVGVQIPERERKMRLQRWKSGAIRVLYANRMLLEGFDEPRCPHVWLDKETDSPILLVQMAGRALRYRPGKVARLYCASEALQDQLRAALQLCNQPHLRLV